MNRPAPAEPDDCGLIDEPLFELTAEGLAWLAAHPLPIPEEP
jgi:hypothetical protein